MIKVNNFVEDYCQLFNPQGEMVGEIDTFISLNDVRIQIKQQKLDGWYIMWPGPDFLRSKGHSDTMIRININRNGLLNPWPKEFFNLLDKQVCFLNDLGLYDSIQTD